jgi:hypothetical protein
MVKTSEGQQTIQKSIIGLADLMGIPEDERERFCTLTWFWVSHVSQSVPVVQRGHTKDALLADAEMKVRAAHKAVRKLCATAEKYQDFNFGTPANPRDLEECERVLHGLVSSFAVMTNSFVGELPNSGPGARDLRKNWSFEGMVTSLFRRSAIAPRRLTFSHNNGKNGTGTIFEALALLAPLLPPGFIPPAPLSSIRRAKNEADKVARFELASAEEKEKLLQRFEDQFTN